MVRAAIVSSARMWSRPRPSNNLPGEKIEHDSQIEPAFRGWHVLIFMSASQRPDWAGRQQSMIEPVGSDGPIVTAVRRACPEPSRCYCPYAMMTHEALDAAAACRVPPGAQGRVESRGAPYRPRCAVWRPRQSRSARHDWLSCVGFQAGHARHNTPPQRRPSRRTRRQ